ncbi:MAG: hypothetical protein VKJ24_10925 [Synechococcales bacterium]|nr:hypothetical protein [Synechococcales bacterium]
MAASLPFANRLVGLCDRLMAGSDLDDGSRLVDSSRSGAQSAKVRIVYYTNGVAASRNLVARISNQILAGIQ